MSPALAGLNILRIKIRMQHRDWADKRRLRKGAFCKDLIISAREKGLKASGGVDADLFPIFAQTLKGNDSVNLGKYSVVSSDAHIIPGMYLCASLPHKNIAG